MSMATQRAALRALVYGVSGVLAVETYRRRKVGDDTDAFYRDTFVRQGKVNGFVLEGREMQSTVLACGVDERNIRWTVKGWVSAVDSEASLSDAEDLTQSICNTLRANPRLSGTASWSEKPEPEPVVTVMLQLGEARYLVHQIEIHMTSHERVAVTYA